MSVQGIEFHDPAKHKKMSRYNPKPHAEAVFNAAAEFKKRALIGTESIFVHKKIWLPEHFEPLIKHYVNNPLIGDEGKMMTKLGQQLSSCPPESVALFTEIYWILLLAPTNMGAENKRTRVRQVWKMTSSPLENFALDYVNSPYLNLPALSGLGSAGPGFNM